MQDDRLLWEKYQRFLQTDDGKLWLQYRKARAANKWNPDTSVLPSVAPSVQPATTETSAAPGPAAFADVAPEEMLAQYWRGQPAQRSLQPLTAAEKRSLSEGRMYAGSSPIQETPATLRSLDKPEPERPVVSQEMFRVKGTKKPSATQPSDVIEKARRQKESGNFPAERSGAYNQLMTSLPMPRNDIATGVGSFLQGGLQSSSFGLLGDDREEFMSKYGREAMPIPATIGRMAGETGKILAALRTGAMIPGISSIANPLLRIPLSEAAGGGTFAAIDQLVNAVKGQDVDLTSIPKEALLWGTLGAVGAKFAPETKRFKEFTEKPLYPEYQLSKGRRPSHVKALREFKNKPLYPEYQVPKEQRVNQSVADSHVQSMIDSHTKTGGFTFNTTTGKNLVGQPYDAVSIFPERTQKITGRDITPEQVKNFIYRNRDLFKNKDVSVGGWFDEATNTSYLDAVVTLPEAIRPKTLQLGGKYWQNSAYGLQRGEGLPIGGTGEVQGVMPPISERLAEVRQLGAEADGLVKKGKVFEPPANAMLDREAILMDRITKKWADPGRFTLYAGLPVDKLAASKDLIEYGALRAWHKLSRKEWDAEMVKKFGEKVVPILGKLWTNSQEKLQSIKKQAAHQQEKSYNESVAEAIEKGEALPKRPKTLGLTSVKKIENLYFKGKAKGGDLAYIRDAAELKRFEPDKERRTFLAKVLAATSINTDLQANASLAIKALKNFIENKTFITGSKINAFGKTVPEYAGYLPAQGRQLEQLRTTGEITGPKISNYYQNLLGDLKLVTVDSWMFRMYGFNDKGSDLARRFITSDIELRAAKYNTEPAIVQAGQWYGYRPTLMVHDAVERSVPYFTKGILMDEARTAIADIKTPLPPQSTYTLTHFSKEPRETLYSRFAGTGFTGEEKSRMGNPGYVPSLWAYIGNVDKPAEKLMASGGHDQYKHLIKGRYRFYDLATDSEGLLKRTTSGDPNEIRRLALARQYDGVINSQQRPGVVEIFRPELKPREVFSTYGTIMKELPASLIERTARTMERKAEESAKNVATRLSKTTLGSGPFHELENSMDLIIIGAAKIARGAANFEAWAREMVAEIGEDVKPFLRDIYTNAYQYVKSNIAKENGLKYLNITDQQRVKLMPILAKVKTELEKEVRKPLTNAEVVERSNMAEVLQAIVPRGSTARDVARQLATRRELVTLSQQQGPVGVSRRMIESLKTQLSWSTDAGRRLQSLKIEANPLLIGEDFNTVRVKIISKLLKLNHDTEEILKAAEGVNWENADQIATFWRKFESANMWDVIDEYRYINLLSSPKTHLVNAFSNMTQVLGLRPATRTAAGIIDPIANALTGSERQFYLSQVPAYYRGVFSSFSQASERAMEALRGKAPLERPDVVHMPTQHPMLKPVYSVTRALEASDVFFRTLATEGEKFALAEGAMKRGFNPAAISRQIEEKAKSTAAEMIFRKPLDVTNETGQGALFSGIDYVTQGVYTMRKFAPVRWFIPFVQTPMNIVKQGIEYSPAGLATLPGNTQKVEQLAKVAVGSTVLTAAAALAFDGKATWAIPRDTHERARFFAQGKQPFAINIGGEWIQMSRLGPIAYPIALAAAIKYYWEDDKNARNNATLTKIGLVAGGMGQFFSDQSYVEGVGQLVSTVTGRGNYEAADAIVNLPSQLIPLSSLHRWVAQIVDPVYRKTPQGITWESMSASIMKQLPFASKTIKPYKSLGVESKRDYPLLNALSPVNITRARGK